MTTQLPAGVIARAKTFGGGHIHIRHGQPDGKNHTATGTCTGCGTTNTEQGRTPDIALNNARTWAWDHSACPFIPSGAP